MTNEEAIFELGYAKDFQTPQRKETIDMAIEALINQQFKWSAIVFYDVDKVIAWGKRRSEMTKEELIAESTKLIWQPSTICKNCMENLIKKIKQLEPLNNKDCPEWVLNIIRGESE